ncbi:hypothetical protein PS928_06240 [Pseudomonas fluorescens]|uniref:Uncharacterized protein n=1 Tax=Pseudomonas fluorescens TaxID=294 RepID=A0A5E7VSQ1_PSEFL|nr:hypothetical protein PS928_06240 [Pseudomonas fluorescens]
MSIAEFASYMNDNFVCFKAAMLLGAAFVPFYVWQRSGRGKRT